MPQIKNINYLTQSLSAVDQTVYGDAISLDGALTFSAACAVTVVAPAPQTFNSGVAALLAVQDLTYTAVLRGTAGNAITIAYTGGGVAGAEVVTVVANAISVQIESGVSTATQVRAAINASVAAIALISCAVTGTGGNAQTTVAAAHLATGANSDVDVTNDTVTLTAHGLPTGIKCQLTTTGTLPAGLTTATDYFIIAVDANTVGFASSLANALAGTKINITDQGSSGAVNTVTDTAIGGATVKLQKSNAPLGNTPPSNSWADEGSASNITTSAVIWLEKVNPSGNWMRLAFTATAGEFNVTSTINTKGPN